nr:hypothetical protein TQ38_17430 [Novosphingobium sp. P6W]
MVATVFSSSALAQSEAAKQGEDLAKSVREGSATTILQSGAENSVPGYGGTDMDASKYLDDDEALTDAGVNARYSDPNYSVVIDPNRPEFDPSTIDLSAAKTIEDTPESFLGAAVGVGGSTASCEPLPNGGASGSTYYETCNEGDQVITAPQSCTSTLVVGVEQRTSYHYYASTTGPFVARESLNDEFASGICKVTGRVRYCPSSPIYGLVPRGDCETNGLGDAVVEDVQCSAEASIYGNRILNLPTFPQYTVNVPATGKPWYKTANLTPIVTTSRSDGCSNLANNNQCMEQGAEVCTDSDPVTRLINGVPVTQPCWAWSRTFQCTERRPANDCSELDQKPECHFDHNECLSENEGGSCNVFDKVYACKTPDTGTGEPGGSICGGDLYCINGECTQVEREASTEFKDAMVAVQAMGNVRDHFDPETMTLFNGEEAGCHKPVFGLVNCCAGKTTGLITTAAGAAAIASGPAAIAALATPFLTTFLCDPEEKMLDVKDRMGLCHYVGTYCSDKVLGVCTSKRKNYCCFESKLSRILQEQGRAQIGKTWGKAKEPDCKGFMIEEFQRLDLSKMDFTEVYSEFIDAAKVPDEVQTSIEIQEKIEQYYELHQGA